MTQPISVSIPSDSGQLEGELTIPKNAVGVVLFAHGSGSSRLSPRNQFVAEAMQKSGIGTLLFDLLTEEEASDRDNVFDIDFLTHRLSDATRWLRSRPENQGLFPRILRSQHGAAARWSPRRRITAFARWSHAEVGRISRFVIWPM